MINKQVKYKTLDKIWDFFHSRLFSKTNLAIISAVSLIMNVGLGGVALKEHKDFESLSNVYATEYSKDYSLYAATENAQIQEKEETTYNEKTQERQEEEIYYVSNQGQKYHVASCSYLKKSRNKVTLEQAEKYGYTPCSRCIK